MTSPLDAAIRDAATAWINEPIQFKPGTDTRGECTYDAASVSDYDAFAAHIPEEFDAVSENMDHLVGFCAGARWAVAYMSEEVCVVCGSARAHIGPPHGHLHYGTRAEWLARNGGAK